MCGIVGIASHEAVSAELHDALIHLQHRGQDAAGIVTGDKVLHQKQGFGLVREVFVPDDMLQLKGNYGIAHVRYPTAGGYAKTDIQPLCLEDPMSIAFAHNGNLVDHHALADTMQGKLKTSLDSEILLHTFLVSLREESDKANFFEQLCLAMKKVFGSVTGSYSVVALIPGKGLIAFRDPHGIRPLVMGSRENKMGSKDYIFSSETTPFYPLGFDPLGDLQPGEVALVNEKGELQRQVITSKQFAPCVFEYVYFARPDATLNNVSVYRSRLRMGQNLAKQWKAKYPDLMPDIVIPAPFTANTAALSFANELGVRYSEGLYKNPFIGRTFIMPNQQTRKRSVRHKLTPQRTEIENKNVLILDDSIVRGTTSREIVKMVREFGAKSIYFVSSCPPIKYPCFYGIDMPSRSELIASQYNEQQTALYLGVDRLLYQTEEDLVEAVTRKGEHHIIRPCMACMDGEYVCGKFTEEKMRVIETQRKAEKVS